MISCVGSKSDREKQMRSTSSSTVYPSELSLQQWAMIQPYFPRRKKVGRKRRHSFRVIFNAILYVLATRRSRQKVCVSVTHVSTIYPEPVSVSMASLVAPALSMAVRSTWAKL